MSSRSRFFAGFTLSLMILAVSSLAHATPPSTNTMYFTYQGRAYDSNGTSPLTSTNVTFKLAIYSHDGNCLLYEEKHTGQNLSLTNGFFNFKVGSPVGDSKRSGTSDPGLTMAEVFSNATAIAGASCTYTPVANAGRRLKLTIIDGASTIVLSPMQEITGAPYAMVAETLQGKDPSKFVQLTASWTQSDIDSLMAKKSELLDLANGTSSLYVRVGSAMTTSLDLGSQRITNVGTPTGAADATNKLYVDSSLGGKSLDPTIASLSNAGGDNGKVLTWNSTTQKWVAQTLSTTVADGSITNAKVASGIDATKITTGTLPVAQVPNLDAGKITTGTYTTAQIPTLDAAKIGSGTFDIARLPVGTTAATVAAGNDSRISGALQKSGGTMSGDLNMGSHNITAVANVPFAATTPTASEDGKTLVFNWNSGTPSWTWVTPGVAGSGLTSLGGQTGTTQTWASPLLVTDGSVATPTFYSPASNQHAIKFPMASHANTTGGLISHSEYNTFNNKADTGSASTFTAGLTATGGLTVNSAFTIGASGSVNMGGKTVNGVGTPSLGTDGVNKTYADTHVAGGSVMALDGSHANKVVVVNATGDGFDFTSSPTGIGTITGITTGAGSHLSGGGTSGTLSLSVATGTASGDIPTLGTGGKLPTSMIDTGVAVGQIPVMATGGKYPAADGSLITNLNADNLTSGTIPAARLPSSATSWTVGGGNTYVTTGNVGIGTSTPGAPLSLGDSLLASSTISSTAVRKALFNDAYTDTASGGHASYVLLSQANSATNSSSNNTALIVDNVVPSSQTVTYSGLTGVLTKATNLGAGNVATLTGALAQANVSSAANVTTARGVSGWSQNTSTGTLTNSYGLQGYSMNTSTGTISISDGSYQISQNSSTGTIDQSAASAHVARNDAGGTVNSQTGVMVLTSNANASSNMGNMYGVNIDMSNSGTISNNVYGIYLSNPTGGTLPSSHYGIYQATSGAKNYFAGNVGIGTASPVSPLTLHDYIATSDYSGLQGSQVTISDSSTATANAKQVSAVIINQPAPASNSSATNIALLADTYVPASAVNYNTATGIQAVSGNASTGTVTTQNGVLAKVVNSSTGTVTAQVGVNTLATNSSTGTVTSQTALTGASTNSAGATVTNQYGAAVSATNNGSVTTQIGLQGIAAHSSASTVTNAAGIVSVLSNTSTGTISSGSAVTATLTNASTGVVTAGNGGNFGVTNTGAGQIGTAQAVVGGITNSGGGTITTAYAGNFAVATTGGSTTTTGVGVMIGAIQATTKFSLYAADATAPSYFAGSIGIGVTPGYPLDVVGDIRTSTCVRTSAGVASGTCASDERLKTDVRPFELGLAALQGINPKYYRYNGLGGIPESEKPELGVIAQDVEKTAPELVTTKSVKLHSNDAAETKIKIVNYNGLIYTVINAVKELHAALNGQDRRLASVESENAQIKAENTRLKEENAAIKAYICEKDSSARLCQ